MSRDYVRGRGSRDVWTSDATLVGGGSETFGLATQIVWGVGAETFAFDAALEGRGTKTDCTSDAATPVSKEEETGVTVLLMISLTTSFINMPLTKQVGNYNPLSYLEANLNLRALDIFISVKATQDCSPEPPRATNVVIEVV
ncbi:hypothetical protein YC2023_012986 [Brassica napus]